MSVPSLHFHPTPATRRPDVPHAVVLLLLVVFPVLPAAFAQVQPPAARPNPTAPAAAAPKDDGVPINIEFPANPAEDVLDIYIQLTGRQLIRDANLAGVNLSILARNVSKPEAIRIIESSFLLNGYVFVPVDDKTSKIINAGSGKNPRSEGVALYADPAQLPGSEEVATLFMPLRFIDPEEATQVFSQHVVPHPYGVIISVPNAQALLITESTTVLRKLAALRDLIDVPPAQVTTEFVQLTQADAESVAEQLTELLEKRAEGAAKSSRSPAPAPPSPDGLPGAPQGGAGVSTPTEQGLVAGQTQIVADKRTNRILIVTRPSNVAYLRALIRQFDAAVTFNDPFVRALQHIKATEVLPLLADLLDDEAESDGSVTRPEASGGSGAGTPSSSVGLGGGDSRSSGSRGSLGGSSSYSSGGSEGFQEADIAAVESVRVGNNISIIADNRANSILLIAPPEARQKASLLLDRLDRRSQQVFLSAIIGQLTLREGEQFSFDYLLRTVSDGRNSVAGLLRTREAANPIVSLGDLADLEIFPLTRGLSVYGAIDKSLDIYVNALESNNRFKVLARPTVYTTNNKKAIISSGQRIPVPSSTFTDTSSSVNNNSNFISNYTYENVLLKLEVIPLINQDREVTLQISQLNESVLGTTTISGNDLPNIGTQEIITTITVPSGATVALGGLIQDSVTRDKNGFPYLSRLPLLGALFRRTNNSTERTELIVLIQPSVVSSVGEGLYQSQLEQLRTGPGRDISLEDPFPPEAPKARKSSRGPRDR